MKFHQNDFNENSWIADGVLMGLTPTVTYCIWHDHQGVRGHIFSTLKKKNSCGGGVKRKTFRKIRTNVWNLSRMRIERWLKTQKILKKQEGEEWEGDVHDEEKGGDSQELRWLGPGQNSGRWLRSCTWCNVLHYSVMTAKSAARTSSHPLLWPFHTALHGYDHQTVYWKQPDGFKKKQKTLKHTSHFVFLQNVASVSVVQGTLDDRSRNMFTWPLHLRDWQSGRWEGAQVLSVGPPGTLAALWTLLTPILSTQLACASLTHAGLLMATAS